MKFLWTCSPQASGMAQHMKMNWHKNGTKMAQKWHRNADDTENDLCYTDNIQNYIMNSKQAD